VTTILPKRPRLRLNHEAYGELRKHVLQRDAWRCQACGSRSNLEMHHQKFRSRSGDDSEQNLITLCAACHASLHRQVWTSMNAPSLILENRAEIHKTDQSAASSKRLKTVRKGRGDYAGNLQVF
jgi:5-methylcytosine-specific restriction endonuclease McrA